MIESNEELLNKFIKYLQVELNLSSNTLNSYASDILQFEKLTNKPFEKIKKEDINVYIEFLYNNFSESTHSRKISSLRKFYKYLSLNYNINNVFSNIKNPKKQLNLPGYFSEKEIKVLLNSIGEDSIIDIRDRAMFELLYATGIRVSELLNIKTYDLKFSDNFIQVTGKGNRQRVIPITSRAIKYVNRYLDIRIKFITSKDDILFFNNKGKRMSRQGFDKILKSRGRSVGIKSISAHKFRHSIASHLLEKGADLRMIQTFLGHQNISTTEIYTHISNLKLKEEYEKYLDIDF